ncbi:MAG: Ig-like domain repeat protein [Acidobacteriota bacterium]|nr:Ig-like domain repeat protein [Acidobacteriota bacterium]
MVRPGRITFPLVVSLLLAAFGVAAQQPLPAPQITTPTKDFITSANTLDVRGTAPASAKVQLEWPGGQQLLDADAAGNWSATITPLRAGAMTLMARTVSGANTSAWTYQQISINRDAKVTVTVTPETLVRGGSLTIRVAVTPVHPGAIASGNITLNAGDITGWLVAPLESDGTFTRTFQAPRNYLADPTLVSVRYDPGNLNQAFGSATLRMRRSPSELRIASSRSTTTAGEPVTFTATLVENEPDDPMGLGEIAFVIDGKTIPATGGKATLSDLAVGSHEVYATFSGDGYFEPQRSAAVTHTVTPATTATMTPDGACTGLDRVVVQVNGSGFTSGMRLLWNGVARPYQLLDTARLTFELDARDLSVAGDADVTLESASGAIVMQRPFSVGRDDEPPLAFAPAPIAIVATLAGGATATTSATLRTFLDAAAARDTCGPVVPLPVQAGSREITPDTLFAPGTTLVQFSFSDAAGNVTTVASAVTVYARGAFGPAGSVPALADLEMLWQLLHGTEPSFVAPREVADVNRDGRVDDADLAALARLLAGSDVSTARRRAAAPAVSADTTLEVTADAQVFVLTIPFDSTRLQLVGIETLNGAVVAVGSVAEANRTGAIRLAGVRGSSAAVARLALRKR